MARILGIDYGERRIGVAISDTTGTIATPLQTIDGTAPQQAARAIAEIARDREVERIVVGLPMRMDGSSGPSAENAKAFGERLLKAGSCPVEYWDERFSSRTAEQALIEGGARRQKRKQVIDKLAAQIILQHYLDSRSPAGLV